MSNQNKVKNILTISLNNYKDLLKTGQLGNYTYNPADVFAWDMYDVIDKSIQWDAASVGINMSPYVYVNDQAESYWWKIQPGMKHEDLDQYFISFTGDFNHSYNRGEYLLTIARHNQGATANNQLTITLNNITTTLLNDTTHGLACAIDVDGNIYIQPNAQWTSLMNIKRIWHKSSLDSEPKNAYARVGSALFGTVSGFTSIKMIYDSGTIIYNAATKTAVTDGGRTILSAQTFVEGGTPLANKYLQSTTASNTYLSKTNASSTYLTKTDASSTYYTKSAANTDRYNEPAYAINTPTLTTMARVDRLRANRLAGGLDPASIICETSTDGGATWVSAGISDTAKLQLFTHTGTNINIPLDPKTGKKSTKCMLRITLTGMKFKDTVRALPETQRFAQMTSANYAATNVYATVSDFYFWLSSNSDRIKITIQHSKGTDPNNWSTIGTCPNANGWSGMNTIHTTHTTFGGYDGQFGNYIFLRFIFQTVASDGSADDSKLSTSYTTSKQAIGNIMGYGANCYESNSLMGIVDRPYQFMNSSNDIEDYRWKGNLLPYTNGVHALGSSSYRWKIYGDAAYIDNVIYTYATSGNSNGTSKYNTIYQKGTRQIMFGEVTQNHDIGFAYRNSSSDDWTFSNTVFFRPSYGAWYWGTGPKLNGNFDIGDNSSNGSAYGKLRDIYMTGSLKNKNGTGVTVDNIINATNRITKYSGISSYTLEDNANYLLVAKDSGVYINAVGEDNNYSEKYTGLLLIGTYLDSKGIYIITVGERTVFVAKNTSTRRLSSDGGGSGTFDLYKIA